MAKLKSSIRNSRVSKLRNQRTLVLASVNEWLNKKDALRILKLVNANGGVTFVDDEREQLKLLFPNIYLSLTDPRKIFGIVLDKDNGWNLCEFTANKNRMSKSMVSQILYKIEFGEPVNGIASTVFKVIKATNSPTDLMHLSHVIEVLLKITPETFAS